MLTPNDLIPLRRRYLADGFVIVRRLLDGAALKELQEQLDRYVSKVVPTLPKDCAFFDDYNRPETLRKMQSLDRHDTWLANFMQSGPHVPIQEFLMGDRCQPQGLEWFDKLPHDQNATPPHQDGFYWNRKPDIACGAWIALDPVNRENGCLWYAPGSHQQGIMPHGASGVLGFSQGILNFDPAKANGVPIELDPGDAVIHSSATVHWTGVNRTSRHRRAVATFCFGASTVRDEEGHARYLASLRSQLEKRGITASRS